MMSLSCLHISSLFCLPAALSLFSSHPFDSPQHELLSSLLFRRDSDKCRWQSARGSYIWTKDIQTACFLIPKFRSGGGKLWRRNKFINGSLSQLCVCWEAQCLLGWYQALIPGWYTQMSDGTELYFKRLTSAVTPKILHSSHMVSLICHSLLNRWVVNSDNLVWHFWIFAIW